MVLRKFGIGRPDGKLVRIVILTRELVSLGKYQLEEKK